MTERGIINGVLGIGREVVENREWRGVRFFSVRQSKIIGSLYFWGPVQLLLKLDY